MSVREQVKAIIVAEVDVPSERITDDAILSSDLGLDSLDFVEVIMALENEYDIELSDDDVEDAKTFGELVAVVDKRVHG